MSWDEFAADVMRMASRCDDGSDLVPDDSVSDSIVAAIMANAVCDERGFTGSNPEIQAHVTHALEVFRDYETLGLVTYCSPPTGMLYKPEQPDCARERLAFFAAVPTVAFAIRQNTDLDQAIADRRTVRAAVCDWRFSDKCDAEGGCYDVTLARGQYLVIFNVCNHCIDTCRRYSGKQKLATGWQEQRDWLARWRRYHWSHDH